jgi:hypothetical protein
MEQLAIETAKSQGPAFVMFCVAIWFLHNMNKGLLTKLNEERNEHLKSLGVQINDLKEAIIECERDRKELWYKVLERSQA